jgi:anti-sigma regulatory factor (Ser/Thr protein kinase)
MPYYRCPACGSLSHSVAVYSTAGVCAVCAAELPDHAKLGVLSESEFGVNRSLDAGLAAPRQARHAVATLPLRELARERLALVVSELVTNSIRHAGLEVGDPIELQMTRDNGQVRIAVHDGGPGFDPRTVANGNGRGDCLGLAIVETLADEWGVDRQPDGCTVWCTVRHE